MAAHGLTDSCALTRLSLMNYCWWCKRYTTVSRAYVVHCVDSTGPLYCDSTALKVV